MSRLLKIALREYLAYVRTIGFWLSMCVMPLGFTMAFGIPAMMDRAQPVPRLAVVDLTGKDYAAAVADAVRAPHPVRGKAGSRPAAVPVASPIGAARDASDAAARLRRYLDAPSRDPLRLDAAAVVHQQGTRVVVDFWGRSLTDGRLEEIVRGAISDRMVADRLKGLGVPGSEIKALDGLGPEIDRYSVKAEAGRVGRRDWLPGLIGFALGMLLWAMVFTGASALLNSVIEEKGGRVMEVLLASASTSEIMGGKILGVAGVTATVLGVWLGIGAAALVSSAPGLAGDVYAVLVGRGLIAYFAIFLAGGYLMYASLFTAVGAFCETSREAQTLLGPMMLVLSVPMVVLGQGIAHPDSPALAVLAWIPPFTPFLAPARAAGGAPLWQMVGIAAEMALASAASIWLATRAFRAGVLSTGRLDLRAALSRLVRR